MGDNRFYDKEATWCDKQGGICCLESQRAKNFAYANRVSLGDWGNREFFGEVEKGYSPWGKFYDSLVGYRHSQYEITDRWGEERLL